MGKKTRIRIVFPFALAEIKVDDVFLRRVACDWRLCKHKCAKQKTKRTTSRFQAQDIRTTSGLYQAQSCQTILWMQIGKHNFRFSETRINTQVSTYSTSKVNVDLFANHKRARSACTDGDLIFLIYPLFRSDPLPRTL